MSVINLNNLEGIPDALINKLQQNVALFLATDNYENLLEIKQIKDAVIEIDEYCRNNQIIGFHYTRAIPESILKSGLVCRSGKEIRQSFLDTFGNDFTDQELILIQQGWNNPFFSNQHDTRDNRLYFNFTTVALYNKGADLLLSNFGGEQIYFPILDEEEISRKLRSLGTPMILKCKLNPKYINTYSEYALGEIAISTFHAMENPNAFRLDQDGFQTVDILTDNIEIIYYDKDKNFRLV